MTSQLRASARLANKPKHNSVYLKKLKNASEFSISDVIACVYAPDVFLHKRLTTLSLKKPGYATSQGALSLHLDAIHKRWKLASKLAMLRHTL
ncbi:unnamed protein product [Brassica oleracea var. botrytis]|uniref:Uncharacterized protein n=1 Tax=Brassica cretica TaxID=69181 RepID=A0A8S9S9F3_BRACR|nr:hypothetical protein F2Q69_00030114 [Brassica cretica]